MIPPRRRGLTGTCVAFVLLLVACSSPPAPRRPDAAPVADVGADRTVNMGAVITLDGSASRDDDGDPLSYQWDQALDNPVSFILSGTVRQQQTLTQPGLFLFILTVTAGGQTSEPDTLRITVSGSQNIAPIAVAGLDYALPLGSTFFLDGTLSSDADGDSVTFLWQTIDAPAAVTIIDSTAAQTRFTADGTGSFRFRLTVSDGQSSHSDDVTVVVTSAGNQPPIAKAGETQTTAVGVEVTLDGSDSSDPEGGAITFRWIIGNNPGESIVLSDSTAVAPRFTPNLTGTYVFGLIVDDGSSESLLDTVVITVVEQIYLHRSGMIEIPGGSFLMGSETGLAGEKPVHLVDLSTFWIDSVEVTVAAYAVCVREGECDTPGEQPDCNFGRDDRVDHPINCVDYDAASAFCGWAGKRLPTEAEWEKSARGPNDQRRYTWGDENPTSLQLQDPSLRLLNFNNAVGTTTAVGQHPDGVSPYSVHNLAGNVMEWVNDWYDPEYYSSSPLSDPPGPTTGEQRVARGGHYRALREATTVSVRIIMPPGTRDPLLGFRCSRTETPD